MTQYYIFEIRQSVAGEYEHIVHWAFDEDPIRARLKAESKFHEIASVAALSETKSHAVSILTYDGKLVDRKCYNHDSVSAGGQRYYIDENGKEQLIEETPVEPIE